MQVGSPSPALPHGGREWRGEVLTSGQCCALGNRKRLVLHLEAGDVENDLFRPVRLALNLPPD